MITVVVFDVDGTIILSNDIKREGFFVVASGVPNGEYVMDSVLSDPPGDRYAIFREFSLATQSDPEHLCREYADWTGERLLNCPERTDASSAIRELRALGYKVYLNSATPEEPLNDLIFRRFGCHFVDGVYGGHGKKVENLNRIKICGSVEPRNILMIGDGIDDYRASTLFGCHFLGVSGGTLARSNYSGCFVDTFQGLAKRIDTFVT